MAHLLHGINLVKINMKKLFGRDKKIRLDVQKNEKSHFVLTSIFKNLNFPPLVRWNSFSQLKKFKTNNSKVSLSNRCSLTVNKKRFNKFTKFSRNVFLKFVRAGKIYGFKKSVW